MGKLKSIRKHGGKKTRKVRCPVCRGNWKLPNGPRCATCKRGRVRMVIK